MNTAATLAQVRWRAVVLVCAGLAAALVIVFGAKRPDFADAVREVHDGALDRSQRLRALRLLVDQGVARARGGDLHAQTIAAAGAIALDDTAAYERIVALHGGLAPLLPGAPPPPAPEREALAVIASLGEPWLRSLLLGHGLESAGDAAAARARFAMAEAGANLARRQTPAGVKAENRLAVELARAGQARCR